MIEDIKILRKKIYFFLEANPNFFLHILIPAIPILFLANFIGALANIFKVEANIIIAFCARFLFLYAFAYLIMAWSKGILDNPNFSRARILISFRTIILTVIIFFVLFIKNLIGITPNILTPVSLQHFDAGPTLLMANKIISGFLLCIFVYVTYLASFKTIATLNAQKIDFLDTIKISAGHESKLIFTGLLMATPFIIAYALYNQAILFLHSSMALIDNRALSDIIWEILFFPIDAILKPLGILLFLSALFIPLKEKISDL